MVEYASTRLMSGCTIATVPASSAVMPPTHATTVTRRRSTSRNGWARHSRNTPAVTMVAAWMSADTGVGPSIASGSQRCSGICALLPTRPTSSSSAIAVAVPLEMRARTGGRSRSSRAMPYDAKIRNIASRKPTSPTRLVTNAFLPATAAALRSNQNDDEQVRAEADALPAEEGDEEARAEDEHQHRGGEQVQVGEEPAEALVAVHVADRIEVDQRADAGDEQDPRDRQRVGVEAHVDVQRSRPAATCRG